MKTWTESGRARKLCPGNCGLYIHVRAKSCDSCAEKTPDLDFSIFEKKVKEQKNKEKSKPTNKKKESELSLDIQQEKVLKLSKENETLINSIGEFEYTGIDLSVFSDQELSQFSYLLNDAMNIDRRGIPSIIGALYKVVKC